MEQNKAERLNENVTEKMCSSDGNVVGKMCSPADTDTCSRDCCGNDSGSEGKHSGCVRIRGILHVDRNVCDGRSRQAVLYDRQRDAA